MYLSTEKLIVNCVNHVRQNHCCNEESIYLAHSVLMSEHRMCFPLLMRGK